jgi:hypothetical protein
MKKKSESKQGKQVGTTQVVDTTPVTPTPPLGLTGRPVTVRDARSAKRLLGKIIVALQKGTVSSYLAKDLCYLLSVYVQICQSSDFEERLEKLEHTPKGGGDAESANQAS